MEYIMEVVCAWCEKEGVVNIMRIIEGPDDQVSHGICERHQEKMLEQIAHLQSSRRAVNPRKRRRRK